MALNNRQNIPVQKNCLHKGNLGKAKLATDGRKLILDLFIYSYSQEI